VKGYPTTWGAAPYKGQVLDYNSTVFNKLETAGGVLLAKLSMGNLPWGCLVGEMTRNPWDITKGASGSSAGSASSVSAGLLPFAIGTETWVLLYLLQHLRSNRLAPKFWKNKQGRGYGFKLVYG